MACGDIGGCLSTVLDYRLFHTIEHIHLFLVTPQKKSIKLFTMTESS
jgi:hypothetical protein